MSRQSPQPEQHVFPVAPAQARFWFLDRVQPGRPDNTIAMRWEVEGDLPADVLEDAIRAVIDRHEILRTRLVERDGTPLQDVLEQVDFKLGLVDIRALPIDDHEARISAIAREMAGAPFDLGVPPLIRVTQVRTARDRATLLIAAHHCAFDGASAAVLGHEIGTLAAAALGRRGAELPELRVQYPDYALWQEACSESPDRADEVAFWTDLLSGADHFALPPDRDGPLAPARHDSPLPLGGRAAPGADALTDAARRTGVSPFMLGAAATSAALAVLSGEKDVLLATAVAGRDEVDLEPMIGVFVNTLVLRLPAAPEQTLGDHLERTRAAVAAALAHQACPLEDVLRGLRPPRPGARTPFTSVRFGMHRDFLEPRDHGAFRLSPAPAHAPGILYDLQIDLVGRADGWHLVIDYDSGRYSEAAIARLADRVAQALDRLVDAPDTALAALAPDRTGDDRAAPAARTQASPAAGQADAGAAAPPAAPEQARAQLSAVWSGLLGLPAEACTGDFFALGGHSILALRMLARVEAEFGRRVDVADFLADPTLEGLARHLAPTPGDDAAAGGDSWALIPLRKGAAEGPVIATINQTFLWHGIAGAFAGECTVINLTVPDCAALARQRAMDGTALADAAAATLADAFPGRAFVLVGHCADGLTAMATAEALDARGQDVRLLAMIDAWAPEPPGARPLRLARRAAGGLGRWSNYAGQKMRGRIGWADLGRRLGPVLRMMRAVGLEPRPSAGERLAFAVNDHHAALWQAHPFGPWHGETVLFATQSQPARAERDLFGWRDTLDEDTTVTRLDGWHEDALLHSGFARLARVIELRLARQGRAHR